MHNSWDIRNLFEGISYISCLILSLLLINLILYSKVKAKTEESDNNDDAGEFLSYKQHILFAFIIFVMLVVVAFLLRNVDIIEYGGSISTVILYVLLKADIRNNVFNKRDENYVVELEKLLVGTFFLVIVNSSVFYKVYVRDISDEYKLQSIVSIVLLSLFSYMTLYYFLMNLYILCGLKKWDATDRTHNKLAKQNDRIKLLRNDMRQYYTKHVDWYKNKSKKVKIIFGVPVYMGVIIYSFINCCKQLINNIHISYTKRMCDFAEASKSYLDNDNFLRFKKSTKQLCIIIALCFIYFWMNFSVGENSSLTKIVSGFATMIIIPIAINRYTS